MIYWIENIKDGSFIAGAKSYEEAIKARLEGELKYFGKYKSKVLNNEVN